MSWGTLMFREHIPQTTVIYSCSFSINITTQFIFKKLLFMLQIELKKLTKTYREGNAENTVINNISEKITAGELMILLGKSGSGKSTLLNLISGIDLPNSGEVVIGQRNLTTMSEQERTLFRRKNIGFVFQFFNLIPTLTVEENLLLPLELNNAGNGEGRTRIAALLNEIGLADRAKTYPDRLSGGEQQRVAIVRALIHQPAIVLADEPTGNLDLETGSQIIQLLDRLVRNAGTTLIMATHSREVIGLADRILTLKDGKLKHTDKPNIPAHEKDTD